MLHITSFRSVENRIVQHIPDRCIYYCLTIAVREIINTSRPIRNKRTRQFLWTFSNTPPPHKALEITYKSLQNWDPTAQGHAKSSGCKIQEMMNLLQFRQSWLEISLRLATRVEALIWTTPTECSGSTGETLNVSSSISFHSPVFPSLATPQHSHLGALHQ